MIYTGGPKESRPTEKDVLVSRVNNWSTSGDQLAGDFIKCIYNSWYDTARQIAENPATFVNYEEPCRLTLGPSSILGTGTVRLVHYLAHRKPPVRSSTREDYQTVVRALMRRKEVDWTAVASGRATHTARHIAILRCNHAFLQIWKASP